jgi:hypothetical protein
VVVVANRRKDTLRVAERRAKMLDARRAGKTFQQIADELGYASASAASKDFSRVVKQVVREPATQLLDLELARIDELWSAHYQRGKSDLWTLDRLLSLSKHRARLLRLEEAAGRDSERLDEARGILGNFQDALERAAAELSVVD